METKKKKKNNNFDSFVCLKNSNLDILKQDHFHHLGLSTHQRHFNNIFSDVKFVITGGSASRMRNLADQMVLELNICLAPGTGLVNLCEASDRYVMYKVGPCLFVNHGIGMSSISVILNEVIKALFYSRAQGVHLIRVGTSGGLGLDPGSVVVTEEALDSCFRNYLEVPVLGKLVKKECKLDKKMALDLISSSKDLPFSVVLGKTVCSWDFYEGQARLDGAVCDYTKEDKNTFLREAHEKGVKNFEMEALVIGALCCQTDIKAAVVCVTLLDRFQTDQVMIDHQTYTKWQERPLEVVKPFIKRILCSNKSTVE